jgi:hypothetical protein
MPKTYTCPFAQNINPQVPQAFTDADGTNVKTCFTAGADDSIIKAIIITSTNGAACDIQLHISNGTTNFQLRRLTIPANAGTNSSVSPVDALSGMVGLPFDEHGNRVLRLRRGFQLKANLLAATSAGTEINVIVLGEDY